MNAPAALAQDEAFARIRLLRSPNIGPVSYAQLLRRFGSAEAALAALPDLASRGGREYRPASAGSIEREIAATRAAGARYLFHDSPGYPALLTQAEGAPLSTRFCRRIIAATGLLRSAALWRVGSAQRTTRPARDE